MQTGDRAHLHEAIGSLRSGLRLDAAAEEAWRAYNSETAASYLILAISATDKQVVECVASGGGGYAALYPMLLNRSADVLYCVASCVASGRRRSFFLTYVGSDVAVVRKGKVSMQKSAVYNLLPGMAAELYVVDAADAAPEIVVERLSKALGAVEL